MVSSLTGAVASKECRTRAGTGLVPSHRSEDPAVGFHVPWTAINDDRGTPARTFGRSLISLAFAYLKSKPDHHNWPRVVSDFDRHLIRPAGTCVSRITSHLGQGANGLILDSPQIRTIHPLVIKVEPVRIPYVKVVSAHQVLTRDKLSSIRNWEARKRADTTCRVTDLRLDADSRDQIDRAPPVSHCPIC